jgi:hypothetical protein
VKTYKLEKPTVIEHYTHACAKYACIDISLQTCVSRKEDYVKALGYYKT